jgi:hypothetical protein
MDIITYILALRKAKSYTNAAVIEAAGVPILPPRINPTTRLWEIWNPMTSLYEVTTTIAEGQTPHIGANGNWFIGTTDTGIAAAARNIELSVNETHIIWRRVGDTIWINLVPLETIRGEPGRDIELRMAGTELEWKYVDDVDWTALYDFSGLELPASILDYVEDAHYSANDVFTDPDTMLIYRAKVDFTSVSIEDDLEAGNIIQIGGGGDTSALTVSNPDTESLSGDAETQSAVNIENVTAIKELQERFYTHTQTTPSDTWMIQHNLGGRPVTIAAVDNGGDEIVGQVDTLLSTLNLLVYCFSEELSGVAYLKL